MINELYELSAVIDRAGIRPQSWHRKYKPIPNIRATAPCVRVVLSQGAVVELSNVKQELGAELRKFGSNQGSYPCMNLAPLYRITDDSIKKALEGFHRHPEVLDAAKLEEIKSWCRENNWGSKFQGKYKISMERTPVELSALTPEYTPLQLLIEESNYFLDPAVLHQALEQAAFRMLEQREQVSLALKVLFYEGSPAKAAADDYGTLSVALESPRLIDMGVPAVSRRFVSGLNEALLSADAAGERGNESGSADAFGTPFEPLEEPMPEVKLAGGFDVKLRTMFKEQRCQERYGRIENGSYPISPEIRKKLQAALTWLGSAEQKNLTWINTDQNEILFAYPAQLPENPISYTGLFRRPAHNDITFSEQAEQFLTEVNQGKKPGTDSNADRIQLFILRKIDKARTKVIYTRQTDPHELETRCVAWWQGCTNLPTFPFGQPAVPFPLDAAEILNRFWKQNGVIISDKYKPVRKYHGIELLLEADLPVALDLHRLSEQAMNLGAFLGNKLANKELGAPIWLKIKDMLALMGLLLHRQGIGKDVYMDNLPYLYGQLLKVSDELHALYCIVVRNGALPTQLAGSGLYQSAAEMPVRTLHLLGQRMNPYIAWAKTYCVKGYNEPGKESWRAGWLLSQYGEIAKKLDAAWRPEARFNDAEKAQLFIGYLAAFPKKESREHPSEQTNQNEEAQNHE